MLPDELAANLRRAEHKFDVMEELGTDMVLVCSSVCQDAVDDRRRIADQFHDWPSAQPARLPSRL